MICDVKNISADKEDAEEAEAEAEEDAQETDAEDNAGKRARRAGP